MPKISKVGDKVFHPDIPGNLATCVEIEGRIVWVKFDDAHGAAKRGLHSSRRDGEFPFDIKWDKWVHPGPPEDPRQYYKAITEKENAQ